MKITNVTDYDNITSSNYTDYDNMTLLNCTINENYIDIIIPGFVIYNSKWSIIFMFNISYCVYSNQTFNKKKIKYFFINDNGEKIYIHHILPGV